MRRAGCACRCANCARMLPNDAGTPTRFPRCNARSAPARARLRNATPARRCGGPGRCASRNRPHDGATPGQTARARAVGMAGVDAAGRCRGDRRHRDRRAALGAIDRRRQRTARERRGNGIGRSTADIGCAGANAGIRNAGTDLCNGRTCARGCNPGSSSRIAAACGDAARRRRAIPRPGGSSAGRGRRTRRVRIERQPRNGSSSTRDPSSGNRRAQQIGGRVITGR